MKIADHVFFFLERDKVLRNKFSHQNVPQA